jgi:hypothetical protein
MNFSKDDLGVVLICISIATIIGIAVYEYIRINNESSEDDSLNNKNEQDV